MSAHVEWLSTEVMLVGPNTEVGEHHTYLPALVIGGSDNLAVVEGSLEDLRSFATSILMQVDAMEAGFSG